jgi:hypothetical protein
MKFRTQAAPLALILVTLITTGCASTDEQLQSKPIPPSERDYVTGSNMPVRRRAVTDEERRKAQDDAQAMRDNAIANQPRTGP